MRVSSCGAFSPLGLFLVVSLLISVQTLVLARPLSGSGPFGSGGEGTGFTVGLSCGKEEVVLRESRLADIWPILGSWSELAVCPWLTHSCAFYDSVSPGVTKATS